MTTNLNSFERGAAARAAGGEYIEINATGLGPVMGTNGETPPRDGDPAPASGSPLYQTKYPVTVSIGGVDAPVSFAGLAPGLVALYQINAQVPESAQTGDAVEVVVTVTGDNGPVKSQAGVTIAVQ